MVGMSDFDAHFAGTINRLDGIQQQVEQHLVDLRAVVLDGRQLRITHEVYFHRLGQSLLAREDDSVLDGRVEVAETVLRRLGTRGLQQVGNDAVDAQHLAAHFLRHLAGGAGFRQVASDDIHHARDSGERIADFMGQAGGKFAERGQVLGARDLGPVEALDFMAALAQLLDHVVEVAAQVADIVVAVGKADGDVEVAIAHALDFFLQLEHGAADHEAKRNHQHRADADGAHGGHDQHALTFFDTEGDGDKNEEQQAVEQNGQHRQDRLEPPVEAYGQEDSLGKGASHYLRAAAVQ